VSKRSGRRLEAGRRPSRIGEQLELELAGPGRAWREPWEGKSPRVLTKTFERFSLGAPPTGGLHADDTLCTGLEEQQLEFELLFPFKRVVKKEGE